MASGAAPRLTANSLNPEDRFQAEAATTATTAAATTTTITEITVQGEVVEAAEVEVEEETVRMEDPAVEAGPVEMEIGTAEVEEGTEMVTTAETEMEEATAGKILKVEGRAEVFLTWTWTLRTCQRRPRRRQSGSRIIRTSMPPKFLTDFSI